MKKRLSIIAVASLVLFGAAFGCKGPFPEDGYTLTYSKADTEDLLYVDFEYRDEAYFGIDFAKVVDEADYEIEDIDVDTSLTSSVECEITDAAKKEARCTVHFSSGALPVSDPYIIKIKGSYNGTLEISGLTQDVDESFTSAEIDVSKTLPYIYTGGGILGPIITNLNPYDGGEADVADDPAEDSDEDGIVDSEDACPDEPEIWDLATLTPKDGVEDGCSTDSGDSGGKLNIDPSLPEGLFETESLEEENGPQATGGCSLTNAGATGPLGFLLIAVGLMPMIIRRRRVQ